MKLALAFAASSGALTLAGFFFSPPSSCSLLLIPSWVTSRYSSPLFSGSNTYWLFYCSYEVADKLLTAIEDETTAAVLLIVFACVDSFDAPCAPAVA